MALLVNAYCTAIQPPALDFPHQLNAHRDRTDPALGEHLQGMRGFVMQGERQMNQTLYAVLRHIERVQQHYSFNVEEEQFAAMSQWGWQANAILFLPTAAITDPSGQTLVDPADGSATEGARVPYPVDAAARKRHHDEWLRGKQIPVASALPPAIGESEVSLRDAESVAQRMMALTLVAIRAESLTSNEPIPPTEMRERFPTIFEQLTPSERTFMDTAQPTEQEVVDHTWKYEAADTLRWALGRASELPFPSQICDVPAIAGDLVQSGPEAILAAAELRRPSIILDQLDLHLRLHWATRESKRNQTEAPAGLDASVLQERRHALNWLVRFENAEWDDVDTPT